MGRARYRTGALPACCGEGGVSMSERVIIKAIEDTCQSGRKAWDVYEDWLDITLAALEAMPRHAASITATGRPAEDTPDVQDLYTRLRTTYAHADFERFTTAFHALTDEAQARGWGGHGETWDIMGSVYMQLNVWSGHSGQYFTPWSIAEFMARMSLGDVETDIRRRIAEAIDRGPWGVMGMANGASITQPGKEQVMLQALAQNYAYLEPLTVCDPACGRPIPGDLRVHDVHLHGFVGADAFVSIRQGLDVFEANAEAITMDVKAVVGCVQGRDVFHGEVGAHDGYAACKALRWEEDLG